ncbi:hypothetical protein [Marinilactibacillus psychrotolerans]|uniref:hypothetical protein n=1 Tax=Marinilactibacillus psychrotolerans TaxID=191770 RepID=UPI0039AEC344
MKRKIIMGSTMLLTSLLLLYFFLKITKSEAFSPSFLVLALISIIGMIASEKSRSMFKVTFFMFISSNIGLFAEIMQYFKIG